jgi:glutaredoxin-like protein NrdH
MSQVKSGHITGKNKGKVVMYGLSTCIWCKKTRQLLTDLGMDFDYVYVDLLPIKRP